MENVLTDEALSGVSPLADRRQGSDRRREVRMASRSGTATICVAAREPIEVQIRDVSRSGLGIVTSCPMLVNSSVVVNCGGLTINGIVRHCRERVAGEYTAGIAITRIIHNGGREI
jgi:hypothetical protein